ncbi:MAG TPA: DUF5335 family protein [Blastocatellia bacterium]|nr:DUF5335 family protein [Blastocatellia bacterium]
MQGEIRREELATYFREFSKRNHARPTRLEIFGELGAQSEESHLPLGGISVENTGKDAPRIEIMLGGNSLIDPRHLTHTVTRASRITPKRSPDGRDEALEIEDEGGTKTLLRFEALAELSAAP